MSSANNIAFRFRFLFGINYILRHFFTNSPLLEVKRQKIITKAVEELKKHTPLQTAAGSTTLPADVHLRLTTLEVERRENLTESEFIEKYMNTSVPVIFSGEALNWPCTQKWNFDFLSQKMSDTTFTLFDSPGLIEKEYSEGIQSDYQITEKISASKLATAIKNGEKKYVRFSTVMDDQKELTNDLNQPWLKKMRRCLFGVCYQNFIGAAERKTPLHAESTAFFYIMADGEKEWRLLSAKSTALLNPVPAGKAYAFSEADLTKPDLSRFPGLELVSHYRCLLKKGDILFVPSWMWHQVENVTDSWGLSYSFTNFRGFIKHPALVFARVFLSKPSFLKNLVSPFVNFEKKSEKTYALPKIFRD